MKFPAVTCLLAALSVGGLCGCRHVPVGQTARVGSQQPSPHTGQHDAATELARQDSESRSRDERLHTMSDPFLLLTSDVSEPVDDFLVQLTGEIVEYGEHSNLAAARTQDAAVQTPVVPSAEQTAAVQKPAPPSAWRQFEPRGTLVIENGKSPSSSVAPTSDFQMPLIVPANRKSVPAVVQPENAADAGVDVVVPSPVELLEEPSTETKVEPSPKGLTVPPFPALPGVTDLGT